MSHYTKSLKTHQRSKVPPDVHPRSKASEGTPVNISITKASLSPLKCSITRGVPLKHLPLKVTIDAQYRWRLTTEEQEQ